jgi:hypothetical protein
MRRSSNPYSLLLQSKPRNSCFWDFCIICVSASLRVMPRKTVKLGPQQGDSHDGLASHQLRAELQSCVETDESRRQDARRRLLEALESDFQDYEPTLRPSKRRLPWNQHQPSKRRTLPWSSGPINRLNLGACRPIHAQRLFGSLHSHREPSGLTKGAMCPRSGKLIVLVIRSGSSRADSRLHPT